jgi:uncharacterized protein YdhG (YjbR/CyaY superfamily)
MIDVDSYIYSFPDDIQVILTKIRHLVKKNVPNATESFSYNMAAYKTFGKPLLYFAAFKSHIGLYATPSGHEYFKEKLAKYKQGKGSVQFPLDHEIPYKLIEEIIIFRRDENKTKFG